MKKKRKSSRKAMMNRARSRTNSPSYGIIITREGNIERNPLNRKAIKIEMSLMRRADGITETQHNKEKRKQRLIRARRKLSKVQAESRKINRANA